MYLWPLSVEVQFSFWCRHEFFKVGCVKKKEQSFVFFCGFFFCSEKEIKRKNWKMSDQDDFVPPADANPQPKEITIKGRHLSMIQHGIDQIPANIGTVHWFCLHETEINIKAMNIWNHTSKPLFKFSHALCTQLSQAHRIFKTKQGEEYGDKITELDFSHNQISYIMPTKDILKRHLMFFLNQKKSGKFGKVQNLKSLVLDNNQLESNQKFSFCKSLTTLWVNNNNVNYYQTFRAVSTSSLFSKMNFFKPL